MMEGIHVEKYPAYKDSGVEWLGEIPEHWDTIRGSYVFKIINERSKKGNETLLSVSEQHGVRPRSEATVSMFMAESYEGYKLCYPGDLVINSLWAWSRGLGVSKYKGIISTAYSVYRPNHDYYDKNYLHYLLRITNYVAQYLILSKGIWISRLLLSDWSFLRLPILSPSLKEQTAIAAFLDRKTAQIDKAIAQKEKLIELLKERRQILIYNAVTCGLNADVPMKDSGVEWIGEIPESWKVKRLKRIVKNVISGPFGSSLIKDDYVKEGYKVYGQEQVIPNNFKIGNYYISEAKFLKMKRYEIIYNDILISCVGTFGKIALVPENFEKGIINPRLIKVTPISSIILPVFLQEILLSSFCFDQFEELSRGGTMGVINIDLLSKLLLIVPPIEEQIKIYNFLHKVKINIATAISCKEKEIEKLMEYKSTLINSAVTGKIKV